MIYRPRDWSSHPPYLHTDYRSTQLRSPTRPLLAAPALPTLVPTPVMLPQQLDPLACDLTRNGRSNGEPLGERIVVSGRVLDDSGRPVPHALVEIWQANAAGRYLHRGDRHAAPIDPNFLGAGHTVTDAAGCYRFYTIKPGAYPWGNHANAWRPLHIHFSLVGRALAARLVTQMYFPGDPLLALDPIYQGTPVAARERLLARFDIDRTEPDFALGYVFDIVLRGPLATPSEH